MIADFKLKSHQSVNEKIIDFKLNSISAITLDALDVKSAEGRRRLSQSKGYRMVPLSGTFTAKSGGVFCPQNSKRACFKAPKI